MRITKKQLNAFLNSENFLTLAEENKLPTSSWLFVTHNRCPYPNPEKNPLAWAFQTLVSNKFYNLQDYVVVDDCSNDYTKSTVEWLRRRYTLPITYVRNKKRLGCSASRKVGLRCAKNNLVFMGDDDCLYGEYFLAGALLTYRLLKLRNPKQNIAVINFPVYEKNPYPTFTVNGNNLGRLDLKHTFFYHEFDKMPEEYMQSPQYLDRHRTILKPLRVDTFKGVNLSDRRLIARAGNYMDSKMWTSSYSEHLELSYQLRKKRFAIYHQPDPKISCLHLKYGDKTRDRLDPKYAHVKIKELKYDLGEMVRFAEIKRPDSGGRLPEAQFHTMEIGSFLAFYLKISLKLGLQFAKNQYRLFVEEGKIFSTTPRRIIRSRRQRQTIFFAGIAEGIKAIEEETGRSYSKAGETIIKRQGNI